MKRRMPKYAALVTMLALGLTAAFVIGGPVASAQGKGTCLEGGTKIENPTDPQLITASAPITAVAIKAGTNCFIYPTGPTSPCYTVTGLGTTSVTVDRVGSGSECKEISHIEYVTGTVTPPPPPPPPPTTSTVITSTVTT